MRLAGCVSYVVEDWLVLSECQHSEPMTQVLEKRSVGEVGHALVTLQQHLSKFKNFKLADDVTTYNSGADCELVGTHSDVAERFADDVTTQFRCVEVIQ